MPEPRRRAGSRARLAAAQTALVVGLVLAWQFVLTPSLGDFWIGRPSDIATTLAQWLANGDLLWHTSATLWATFLGYLFGTLFAVVLAFTAVMFPLSDRVSEPYVTAFYVFPRETIAPIFIIFLGLGLAPKVALSAFAVFFVVYINALAGARQVDKDLMNVMRVSGANRWHLFEMVIVPATIPWIFTGMRIAIRFAFTNTLFGEMLSGNRGLGFVIRAAANNMEASEVFAGILVVMVVNVLLGVALQRAERFATRWKI